MKNIIPPFTTLTNPPPTTPLTMRSKELTSFLGQFAPDKISKDEASTLEAPITISEWEHAIKQLKPGKSPGPDGLSAVYYKTFSKILQTPFLKAFNSLSPTNPLTRGMLEAHIVVIPKDGKDPTQAGNYRPISLLNSDIKLYSKILANRLLPLLPSIISQDQAGFIPGREARDNTIKAINPHHLITQTNQKGFFLSPDAEKAFDRVSWDYMTEVLGAFGIGPHMIGLILSLYANPSARVRVNNTLSNAFPISNGTRQGCPLSPILFVLTLEPFLRKIKLHPDIQGFQTQTKEYKYAAFADDILLFLTNPLITLPTILSEFKKFQSLSNLKINLTKSHALNISLPQNLVDQCKENFPFHWKKDSITYLGIQLTSKLADLYTKNHLPFLNTLSSDLKLWNKPLFSWFGRAAILKMNALPRLLYMLQTIPIHVPPSFFKTYRQICSNFLWSDRPHRISYNQLIRQKHLGGIGLPNLRNYHTATLLTRIVDWNVVDCTCSLQRLDCSGSILFKSAFVLTPMDYPPTHPITHPPPSFDRPHTTMFSPDV